MPPKGPPKIYIIQLRSHKLTAFFTRTPTSTIKELKEEAKSAFASEVVTQDDIPVGEFEIFRDVSRRGARTPEYQLLEESKQVKDCGLSAWEVLYLSFYDPQTKELRDVEYTPPPTFDDEPEAPAMANKGKRKADDSR